MAHKYAFILLGGSGTTIRQFQFSRKKLIGLGVCIIFCIAAICYGFMDYIGLHQKIRGKEVLERKLSLQTEEVIHQREQIQKFAEEINALKEKLLQLDEFKKSICIIANIDKANSERGLFGIGGSTLEDLNASIELTQRHQRLIKDMHRQMGQLEQAAFIQRDEFESLLGELESQKNILAHTPAIRPAKGLITSKFGYRQSPFTGRREFHKGLDIANQKGSPIIATADGVVTYAGHKGLFGNMVVIDHGYGIVTRYAHLDKIIIKQGKRVHRSDVIGHMGNSGRSTGSHLHYEVRLNGAPVNPSKYFMN